MRINKLISLAICFLLAVCIGANAWASGSAPNTDDLHRLIQEMVDPHLESRPELYGPAPGAVLQVDGPDFHFLETAGFANPQNKFPIKADDRFEIGSNTKMFTAVLLVQLTEQEVLTFADHLAKWLPEWAAKIPNGNKITLRHLATHTSGIRDYADDIIGAGVKNDMTMHKHYTPAELVRYALDNGKPDFAPGEKGKWKYCNTGYILLGMVLEKASGKRYGDLLRERIFAPLKLKATTFPDSVPEDKTLVPGFVSWPGGKNTTKWNLSQGWAAGGIISTTRDLRTFLRTLANGKLFKNPSSLLTMANFVENNEVRKHTGAQGYGIGLIEYGNGVWGHGGQTLGYESGMMFVPGTDITMIALTNASQGPILQIRSLVPVLQKMAGIEAKNPATSNPFKKMLPKK